MAATPLNSNAQGRRVTDNQGAIRNPGIMLSIMMGKTDLQIAACSLDKLIDAVLKNLI